MTRAVYVNGRYRPYREAMVHVEDRGFQFADAIYEVCEIRDGRLVDEGRHLDRLERSLSELEIALPMSRAALGIVLRETVRRNRVVNGLIYLQVSRGAAPRDFAFPGPGTPPTVVCLARRLDPGRIAERARQGIAVSTTPDTRWARCDIKTVMLLPACLAKETARKSDAFEAWFVDRDGFVTEGASSNAWIVDGQGTLVTRHLDEGILPGVTRRGVFDALAAQGLVAVERPFRPEEAYGAREAFITSASATVMPVVKIDGRQIGDGRPGPMSRQLRAIFHRFASFSDV